MTTPWIQTENISSTPEGFPQLIPNHLLRGNHYPDFCHHDLFYLLLNFTEMKSDHAYLFESGSVFSLKSMTFIRVGDTGTVHSPLLPRSSPRMNHSVCIHPSVDGHRDCFQFGVIKNKVTWTFLRLSFAGHEHSLLLGIHPGTRGGRCSVLVDTAKLSKGRHQFTLLARWGEF